MSRTIATKDDCLTPLVVVGWTVPFTACATVTAALITQAFLGHRLVCLVSSIIAILNDNFSVLILTKSKLLTALIGVCSIASFACGIYSGIKCGMINEFVLRHIHSTSAAYGHL